MSKYLVVVESPEKAKKIGLFLGKDYKVIASVGHVIDLPAKGLNVNIKKSFEPTYDIMPGKEDVVKEIVKAAKGATQVYLMSDPDREGEAIAWHLSKQLPKGVPFKRAKTNSITKQSVQDAINNANNIDYDLVDSYETRRILDRLVGYKCSFLTTTATGGKSAGRVQSAALRVLAERESEIKSFIPEEYWNIEAVLLTKNKEKITVLLVDPDKMKIKNKEYADKILSDIKNQNVTVSKYDSKETFTSPRPPFTTSTLQQTAASVLGWDQEKTMKVAQKLYENGHITYLRSDSVSIVPEKIIDIRNYISNNFAKEYLPNNAINYTNKSANVQAAHEAIRPVDFSATTIVGDVHERSLYEMIWKRTVASQMEKTKSLSVSARFRYAEYEFGATGSTLLFDGWRKVWDYTANEDKILPSLKVGETCEIVDIKAEQKFTQPPSRYTKSSITKMYEETGIGRPSTYVTITKTLLARKYINLVNSSYHVTDLGMKVSEFLIKSNFCFIDLNFTSDMEEKLDKIGDKNLKKIDVLSEFWNRLKSDIDNALSVKKEESITDFDCLKCKKNKLLKKHGKFGSFYACPDKECKFTCNISKDGTPKEKVVVEKVYGNEPCPLCQNKMILRKGSKGDFYGCSTYPKCKGLRDLENNEIVLKPKTFNKKKFFKKKSNNNS